MRYHKAAAGFVGCLLVGGTIGNAIHQRNAARANGTRPASAPAPVLPSGPAPKQSLADVAHEADVGTVLLAELRRSPKNEKTARPTFEDYLVKAGDSFWSIAQEINSDVDALIDLNPGRVPERLLPGEKLDVVRHFHGAVYIVQSGDTLSELAVAYGVEMDRILFANALISDTDIHPGDRLVIPGAEPRRIRGRLTSRGEVVTRRPAPVVASAPPAPVAPSIAPPVALPAPSPTYAWPVNPSDAVFTTEFGGRHRGLDMAVPQGTLAVAARSGTVVFSGYDGGYGYCVIIDHGGGFKTRYAHASSLLVKVGQWVEQGKGVILVGSTGNSTGPHLHFEVIVDGTPRNPRLYLPR